MKLFLQEYKGYLLFLFFIMIMGMVTIFGDRGLIHLNRLNQELKKMESDNERTKKENQIFKKEIYLLKNNNDYLEETIRKEVGLVHKNEVVYQLKK